MEPMKLNSGNYILAFRENNDGGIGLSVYKKSCPSEICQYETSKPAVLTVKDYAAKAIDYCARCV